jgi:hypothetical protein
MILSLKILRGVDLVAMDYNLASANSSDPYCEVYVNGKKIAWTPVQYNTLNPVWGGPMSTFKIMGGGGTKITIKILDYDALSADDPMGEVTFYAQDLLLRTSEGYPNAWATVEPSEGCDKTWGKLQVRLLEVSESTKPLAPPPQAPLKLSAGPKLSTPATSLRDSIASAKAPVLLHIYDVGGDKNVRRLNSVLPVTGAGGIFHAAIEIYGKEYSFGFASVPVGGIFACKPTVCPSHTFRESVYLGDCELSHKQVQEVLKKLKPKWMAPSYHLLRKNCCFFSNEFAIELGVGGIPEWVYSLANLAAGVVEMMNKGDKRENTGNSTPRRTTWRGIEVPENQNAMWDLTMVNAMAVRLQRAFRARKLVKNEREGVVPAKLIRRATTNNYNGMGFEIVN